MSITTRSGIDLNYDTNDAKEHFKLTTHGELNRSIEFYLKDNLSNYTSKALIVGAGVGLYSAILDSASITTINIEPIQSRFDLLEQNTGSSATNINKACGATSGTGDMYYFSDNKSGAQLDTNIGNANEAVDVITIDSLDLQDVDVMVIVANGQEVEILKGATQTIIDNPGMDIIIYWNSILSSEDDYTYIVDNFTPKIIHCDADATTTTIREIGNETYPLASLKAVIESTLLLS
jgi:FkbM family methyltransferase